MCAICEDYSNGHFTICLCLLSFGLLVICRGCSNSNGNFSLSLCLGLCHCLLSFGVVCLQYAGITLMATLLKETVSLSTRAVEHLLVQDMAETKYF